MADKASHVRFKAAPKVRTDAAEAAKSVCLNDTRCPSCGWGNVSSSSFCAECGTPLGAPDSCPRCKAVTLPDADICEACGNWLVDGKCKFCSAPLSEDQAYCGSCGNPAAGITCQGCGETSFFDFCKTCTRPLSRQAQDSVRRVATDPTQLELAALLTELHASEPVAEALSNAGMDAPKMVQVADDQIRKMKMARAALSTFRTSSDGRTAPRALFSDKQRIRISLLGEQVALEEKRQRREQKRLLEEAQRRRKEEEERRHKVQNQINQSLSRLANKTFASNQDARRFFMSLLAGLPEEVGRSVALEGRLRWRCNAYSCEHDSPAECAAPSHGGVWLFR